MHLALSLMDTVIFMLCISIGARTFGAWFRRYSLVTFVTVLLSGILTGLEGTKVAANKPTPWLGVKESVAVFGSMLWISVFSLALIWQKKR